MLEFQGLRNWIPDYNRHSRFLDRPIELVEFSKPGILDTTSKDITPHEANLKADYQSTPLSINNFVRTLGVGKRQSDCVGDQKMKFTQQSCGHLARRFFAEVTGYFYTVEPR